MDLFSNAGEYAVNALTMVVMPERHKNKLYSRIIQTNGEFLTAYKPTAVIKKNCLDNCSSYEGRVAGSRYILGSYQKVPIMINSENQMYFFPTASPEQADCIWINPIHILKYSQLDKKTTLVIFKNKINMKIPVSYHTFSNQVHRTNTLQNKMNFQNLENEGNRYII